jgi:histidinol-phosphate aminotransferase
MKNPTRSGGLPDFQRDNIARMEGYLPGEQLNDSSIIKLNTNENPFPPSTPVQEALRKLEPTDLRRYPDPLSTGFRSAIAQTHGLNLDATIATRGGDELLRLVITTFVEPGSTIGMTDPTYSLYETLAEIHACPTFKVDISRHWKPAPDFAAMMNHINARLILLVNPHAPSGSLLPISQIDAICAEARGIVLLDEAYIDFVDPALAYDAIPLLARHGNLIILRTLSKGYSLAGMRLGYGLASPGLIAPMLTKTRDSYNLDTISQRVGEAALAGRDESRRSWATVRAERARLRTELAGRGIETLPSESNFLLARIPNSVAASDGPDAHRTYLGLKDRKILVRYFSTPALADRLRISVGTPEENSALLAALDDIRAGK